MLAVAHGPRLQRSVDVVRPFARGLTAVLAAGAAVLATGPAPAHADTVATAPRAYELVSPSEKGGNDIGTGYRATADGEAVAFVTYGGFAGATGNVATTVYRSHRTDGGWVTDASVTAANASPAPWLTDITAPADFSDDLTTAYYTAAGTTLSPQDQSPGSDVFAVSGGQASWLSPGLTDTAAGDAAYAGRSSDGRHIVIESSKPLVPGVPATQTRVYDVVDGRPRLASVPPSGTLASGDPAARFGNGRGGAGKYQPPDARAISTDGSRIFFTAGGQLYARIDGTTTELISATRPSGLPDSGANAAFMGASDNGHVVVFRSDVPLNAGETSGGLYRYDENTDSLQQLAAGAIAGTIRTTPDGARTYFVSTAALAGAAVAGDDNLYVAGDVGLRFVAKLAAADVSYLWHSGEFDQRAGLSPDGRRLAFMSAAVIGAANTTSGLRQIYVYDSDRDAVTCVSCPPAGATPHGNADLRDASGDQRITPLVFATDGTVFFETTEPLAAADTDTQFDVYAYDGDGAHLVSTGTDLPAYLVGNSADGRDVFLRTSASLAAADHDGGYADIYDARVGGGFPEAPAPCAGEACRGPQSAPPAPAPAPGSLTATDTTAAAAAPTPRVTFKLARISAATAAKWPRTGKLTLSVHVSDDAAVTAKATATLGKKTTVASHTAVRAGAGTVKVPLTLAAKARSALKRSHKLTVKIAVTCTDSRTTAHATVVLRTKAPRR